jgi:H+/Cl- antiporter ClcA
VHGWPVDSDPLLPFPSSVSDARRFQWVLIWIRLRTGHITSYWRGLGGGAITSLTGYVAWVYFGETWTFQGGLPLAHALFAARFIGGVAIGLLLLELVSVWSTFGTSGMAGLLVVTLTVGALTAHLEATWDS